MCTDVTQVKISLEHISDSTWKVGSNNTQRNIVPLGFIRLGDTNET